MKEIKFRLWDSTENTMHYDVGVSPHYFELYEFLGNKLLPAQHVGSIGKDCEGMYLMQYTGLTDLEDNPIYIGDVLEFDEGDRIIVSIEDYLEVYANPIGNPECEDQWRDLYRIERSTIIGNIYQNPELIKPVS